MAHTVEVTVTETVTIQKTVTLTIQEGESTLKSDLEQRAREEAYKKLVTNGDHGWDLVSSDGPDFEIGDLEVDYSDMSSDDEHRILSEILQAEKSSGSIESILDIGDVDSILREEWNNDIIARMEQDGTDFDTAFSKVLAESSVSVILASGNVFSELREHYNNDILDRWAREHKVEILD